MTTHTTASLADALDTTPRTLRKFLRSQGSGVGKGSRYALDLNSRSINAMRKEFDAWQAARAEKIIADAPAEGESDD